MCVHTHTHNSNLCVNLSIYISVCFTNMLLFVYIRSTLNIYWFISIWIHCQRIQTNSYLVTFDYLWYSVRYSMNEPEGKKNTICCYLISCLECHNVKCHCADCCGAVFYPFRFFHRRRRSNYLRRNWRTGALKSPTKWTSAVSTSCSSWKR